MSDPDRVSIVAAWLSRLADAQGPAREAILLELKSAPPSIHDEVLSLAAHAPEGQRLLDPERLAPRPMLGRRIGRFELGAEIGRGGMGRVFEGLDTELRRPVAVKITRWHASTPAEVQRLRHEALVQARLQHPGIATVIEAGAWFDDGEPSAYVVSELIPSAVRLDQHARHADDPAKLRLIVQVARAVHHAHLRHVLHCDLKPANVLVDPDGRVKVIDFGLGRLAETGTSARSTITGQVLGTPHYMSPEQALGAPLDVRSDVYSLGVMLYELLAGELPLRPDVDTPSAWLHSIPRLPPVPLRLRRPDLPCDAATIVHMAIQKDPALRYQSAQELADDIERYLRAEPIRARPPTAIYRATMFVRRNRVLVASLAAVFLSLVAGVVVSQTALARARRAEAQQAKALQAEQAALVQVSTLFESVNFTKTFIERVLSEADPFVRARLSGGLDAPEPTVEDALANASRLIDGWNLAPAVEASLRSTIGNILRARGDFEAAEPHLRAALAQSTRAVGRGGDQPLRAAVDFAAVLTDLGRLDEALAILAENHRLRAARGLAPTADSIGERSLRANILDALGRQDEALDGAREAASLAARTLKPTDRARLQTLNDYAAMLARRRRLAEAASIFEDLARTADASLPDLDPDRLAYSSNLAACNADLDRLDESLRIRQIVLARQRAILGDTHPDTLLSMGNLGGLYVALERFDDAERLLRNTIAAMRLHLVPGHPGLASASLNLASALLQTDRACEAEPLAREAASILAKFGGTRDPYYLQAVATLADCLARLGRPAEGLALVQLTMHDILSVCGTTPPLAQHFLSKAACRFALGQIPDAEADAQHARDIMLAAFDPSSSIIRRTDHAIADARALALPISAR